MQPAGQIPLSVPSALPVYQPVQGKIGIDTTPEFQSIITATIQKEGSFFTGHPLKVHQIQAQKFNAFQPDWILGILLIGFIFLAWVQVFYRTRFRQILMAPFSRRFLSQLTRDGDLFSERIALVMGFMYFVSMSLLICQACDLLLDKKLWVFFLGFKGFVMILSIVLGFWIGKISLIKFLALIFRTRQTTNEYLLNIFIFSALIGVILLPLLVIVIYLKSVIFLWICFVFFILLLIFRFVRGFLIGASNTKFSYLFLFVYLCSLELLPLVVLMKLFLIYPF